MSIHEDALYVVWKWLVSRGAIALCKRVNVVSNSSAATRRLEFMRCIEYAIRVLPIVCKFLHYEDGERIVVHSCITYSAYVHNYFVKHMSPCRHSRRDPATLYLFETNTIKDLRQKLVENHAVNSSVGNASGYYIEELLPTISAQSDSGTQEVGALEPFKLYYLSKINSTACPLHRLSLINQLKHLTAYSINVFDQNMRPHAKLLGMPWAKLVETGEFILSTQNCSTTLVQMISFRRVKAFLALLVMIDCVQSQDVYFNSNKKSKRMLSIHCAGCGVPIMHHQSLGNPMTRLVNRMQVYRSMHKVLQSISSYNPTKWMDIYTLAVSFATRNYSYDTSTCHVGANTHNSENDVVSFFHTCAKIELPTCSKVCLHNVLSKYDTTRQYNKFPLNILYKWNLSKDPVARRIATAMINLYSLSFRMDIGACYQHSAEDVFEKHQIDMVLHTNMQTTNVVLDMTFRV